MEKTTKIRFNILAIISIIIFCAALSPVTLQNDTFYTIEIGKHILENGIDMIDPFSWHENMPYTYPHWLYDVGIYLIYSIGGQLGIYISTIVLASILGIVVYLTNTKITKNRITSFFITLGVMWLLKDYIAARAQLVTFILFALTIFFIEQFIETKKRRYVIGLIIIPILIANLHVAVWPFYFILYLPYIAEYAIACIKDPSIWTSKIKIMYLNKKLKNEKISLEDKNKISEKIISIEQYISRAEQRVSKARNNPYKIIIEKKDNVKWLILIMVICALTGLLTPLGDTPYTYLYNTMQGNTTKSISEHLPLTLISNIKFMCVIIIFLSIISFTDTKIKLRDLFMTAGLLLLSFNTRRQVSMFILICSYVLNRLICSIFDKYDKEGCNNAEKIITKIPGLIISILLVLLVSFTFVKPKLDDKFIDEKTYPVAASDFIINNLDLNEIKLFNEYNYGSYLLFRGIPVFIDSRADLYAPEFNKDENKDVFSDFISLSSINKYYEEVFDKYEITHVILYNNSRMNIFISRDDNYNKIHEDDYFSIYTRLK